MRRSNIVLVQSFRADCGTDLYVVVANFRERLSVSKRAGQKFDMEGFDFKNLNDVEERDQCLVKVPNRFAALENLDDNVDISRAWEIIRDTIETSAKESLGYYKLKQHNPWFDEECSNFSAK
jgi:hypothetical protein